MNKKSESFLPLSQATFYILLSLRHVRHGYAIMQDVAEISQGQVDLGPGTLYGALGKLEKQGIILKENVDRGDRRKYYRLSTLGKEVLILEFQRLQSMVDQAKGLINELGGVINDN